MAELEVSPVDYWTLTLECDSSLSIEKTLTARTTIVQPQGFTQVLDSQVRFEQGRARWSLLYPLIDEGRLDVKPGNWNGFWIMGEYRFRTEFLDGSKVVQTKETTFDPMSLCQRDNYGPIFTKYPQQFIECSPVRPAYIDTDRMSFTIRTLPDRVVECTAVVDVIAQKDKLILAGPWTMTLSGDVQQQEFDSSGWPRGEYWIRIRLQKEGNPVGPFLIRKVWKEVLPSEQLPAVPLRIERHSQMLAGPLGMDSVQSIRFVSNVLEKQPARPLFTMDQPWETELLYYKTLHYDEDRSEFVLEYELAGGDKQREEQRQNLPSTICRAVSKNGLDWTKPSLGLVEYEGSTNNNLVPSGQEYVPPRPENLSASLSHDLEKANFRHYKPQQDGPINLQNVFVTAVKKSFVSQCSDRSSHPFLAGSWPMEKRKNEYLVLTSEPILYVGVGMDLYHTTERITLHVEDKSTGTLYYFFRPGAPSYPPHDAPYDNMHMTRRCVGVMWSNDGINWQRRLVLVPDEHDAPGTEYYYITALVDELAVTSSRPAMALDNHWNKAAVDRGLGIYGALTIYETKDNRIWPELVYANDLLHWNRFDQRQKLIRNGPPRSHDFGMIKLESHYHEIGDQWWFPYQAINTFHQDYIGLAMVGSLEQLREEFPNYAEMPGFVNWQQYWQRCKTMRYYTGIGRCLKGRVYHAEPEESKGSLTTRLVIFEGDSLLLNAVVSPSGTLQVEVLNKQGRLISGFEKENCQSIQGDSTQHKVHWKNGQISELKGNPVRLRFLLDRAQLYGYYLQ